LSSREVDFVIIDCCGRIDSDSLAVCQSADAILLVTETDTAAIRASEHLVRVLTQYQERFRRSGRLVGFVIKEAFADPTQIVSASTSFFKSRYLGSIPFDFITTRRFIFGELPTHDSVFFIHVQSIAAKLFPSKISLELNAPWEAADYDNLSLGDPDSLTGGRFCAAILLLIFYVKLSEQFFLGFTCISSRQALPSLTGVLR
jgi:hypothetical protein